MYGRPPNGPQRQGGSFRGDLYPYVVDMTEDDEITAPSILSRPSHPSFAAPRGLSDSYSAGQFSYHSSSLPSNVIDLVSDDDDDIPIPVPLRSVHSTVPILPSPSPLPVPSSSPIVVATSSSLEAIQTPISAKRALSTNSASNSQSKKPKLTSVKIKQEFEPCDFGMANDGDEVIEVEVQIPVSSTPAVAFDVSGGDDIEFIGGNQQVAADMPHQREACPVYPFRRVFTGQDAISGANKSHCPHCYCYVCDVKVAECCDWDKHCSASCKDYHWRDERQQLKGPLLALLPPAERIKVVQLQRELTQSQSVFRNPLHDTFPFFSRHRGDYDEDEEDDYDNYGFGYGFGGRYHSEEDEEEESDEEDEEVEDESDEEEGSVRSETADYPKLLVPVVKEMRESHTGVFSPVSVVSLLVRLLSLRKQYHGSVTAIDNLIIEILLCNDIPLELQTALKNELSFAHSEYSSSDSAVSFIRKYVSSLSREVTLLDEDSFIASFSANVTISSSLGSLLCRVFAKQNRYRLVSWLVADKIQNVSISTLAQVASVRLAQGLDVSENLDQIEGKFVRGEHYSLQLADICSKHIAVLFFCRFLSQIVQDRFSKILTAALERLFNEEIIDEVDLTSQLATYDHTVDQPFTSWYPTSNFHSWTDSQLRLLFLRQLHHMLRLADYVWDGQADMEEFDADNDGFLRFAFGGVKAKKSVVSFLICHFNRFPSFRNISCLLFVKYGLREACRANSAAFTVPVDVVLTALKPFQLSEAEQIFPALGIEGLYHSNVLYRSSHLSIEQSLGLVSYLKQFAIEQQPQLYRIAFDVLWKSFHSEPFYAERKRLANALVDLLATSLVYPVPKSPPSNLASLAKAANQESLTAALQPHISLTLQLPMDLEVGVMTLLTTGREAEVYVICVAIRATIAFYQSDRNPAVAFSESFDAVRPSDDSLFCRLLGVWRCHFSQLLSSRRPITFAARALLLQYDDLGVDLATLLATLTHLPPRELIYSKEILTQLLRALKAEPTAGAKKLFKSTAAVSRLLGCVVNDEIRGLLLEVYCPLFFHNAFLALRQTSEDEFLKFRRAVTDEFNRRSEMPSTDCLSHLGVAILLQNGDFVTIALKRFDAYSRQRQEAEDNLCKAMQRIIPKSALQPIDLATFSELMRYHSFDCDDVTAALLPAIMDASCNSPAPELTETFPFTINGSRVNVGDAVAVDWRVSLGSRDSLSCLIAKLFANCDESLLDAVISGMEAQSSSSAVSTSAVVQEGSSCNLDLDNLSVGFLFHCFCFGGYFSFKFIFKVLYAMFPIEAVLDVIQDLLDDATIDLSDVMGDILDYGSHPYTVPVIEMMLKVCLCTKGRVREFVLIYGDQLLVILAAATDIQTTQEFSKPLLPYSTAVDMDTARADEVHEVCSAFYGRIADFASPGSVTEVMSPSDVQFQSLQGQRKLTLSTPLLARCMRALVEFWLSFFSLSKTNTLLDESALAKIQANYQTVRQAPSLAHLQSQVMIPIIECSDPIAPELVTRVFPTDTVHELLLATVEYLRTVSCLEKRIQSTVNRTVPLRVNTDRFDWTVLDNASAEEIDCADESAAVCNVVNILLHALSPTVVDIYSPHIGLGGRNDIQLQLARIFALLYNFSVGRTMVSQVVLQRTLLLAHIRRVFSSKPAVAELCSYFWEHLDAFALIRVVEKELSKPQQYSLILGIASVFQHGTSTDATLAILTMFQLYCRLTHVLDERFVAFVQFLLNFPCYIARGREVTFFGRGALNLMGNSARLDGMFSFWQRLMLKHQFYFKVFEVPLCRLLTQSLNLDSGTYPLYDKVFIGVYPVNTSHGRKLGTCRRDWQLFSDESFSEILKIPATELTAPTQCLLAGICSKPISKLNSAVDSLIKSYSAPHRYSCPLPQFLSLYMQLSLSLQLTDLAELNKRLNAAKANPLSGVTAAVVTQVHEMIAKQLKGEHEKVPLFQQLRLMSKPLLLEFVKVKCIFQLITEIDASKFLSSGIHGSPLGNVLELWKILVADPGTDKEELYQHFDATMVSYAQHLTAIRVDANVRNRVYEQVASFKVIYSLSAEPLPVKRQRWLQIRAAMAKIVSKKKAVADIIRAIDFN